ncbi:hypothetical protein TRFO_31399 [Tritrichomonas foetus]|uniref:Uncharacterized protein n=1 Tax=Tritrichomonas foetus TaxID=1144522 RepID=A0A1J4JWQ0_9EUKA|nr:hypothetical protein TRFO_31399 [Tritrichomonas foetus]|eukprot:OHT01701.1 hypothetical protein TRFO_31399 [Tritrichomonas foetus]
MNWWPSGRSKSGFSVNNKCSLSSSSSSSFVLFSFTLSITVSFLVSWFSFSCSSLFSFVATFFPSLISPLVSPLISLFRCFHLLRFHHALRLFFCFQQSQHFLCWLIQHFVSHHSFVFQSFDRLRLMQLFFRFLLSCIRRFHLHSFAYLRFFCWKLSKFSFYFFPF